MIQEKKQTLTYEHKLKKEYANLVHKLKIDILEKQLNKEVSLASLRALIKTDDVDVNELKKLWKNGKSKLLKVK